MSFTSAIPSELVCPICSELCVNPVVTPCDHLFCEHDLLQWFVRAPDDQGPKPSQRCPQCNTVCKPDSIRPAGRIITSIIGDLERRCDKKDCSWVGFNRDYERHLKLCKDRGSESKFNDTKESSSNSNSSSSNSSSNTNNHNSSSSSSSQLRALYLCRKLEEATAEQQEASRHGSKEVSLLHRQLAELVQHNKGLSEHNRELKRQLEQYKHRCNILERALLGQDAVDSFDKARADSLREARKYME